MRDIAKEYSFSGVGHKFGNSQARGFHPCSTAKSLEIREVLRLAIWVSKLDWRTIFSSLRECV
jgi:hypothetical protein